MLVLINVTQRKTCCLYLLVVFLSNFILTGYKNVKNYVFTSINNLCQEKTLRESPHYIGSNICWKRQMLQRFYCHNFIKLFEVCNVTDSFLNELIRYHQLYHSWSCSNVTICETMLDVIEYERKYLKIMVDSLNRSAKSESAW